MVKGDAFFYWWALISVLCMHFSWWINETDPSRSMLRSPLGWRNFSYFYKIERLPMKFLYDSYTITVFQRETWSFARCHKKNSLSSCVCAHSLDFSIGNLSNQIYSVWRFSYRQLGCTALTNNHPCYQHGGVVQLNDNKSKRCQKKLTPFIIPVDILNYV
jgi:hypothetical protein